MRILAYFFDSVKTKGLTLTLFHILCKIKWYGHVHKFSNVGNHTYFEPPYIFEGENYITIGNYVTARKRLRMEAISYHNGNTYHPQIIIGDHVSINYDVHIGAANKVVIEEGVLIASKVFITDHDHGKTDVDSIKVPPQQRALYSKGSVYIKKNAWIGEGVAILSGVTIGENSIIGANSVVANNIPDNCIAAGNPAKVIKYV